MADATMETVDLVKIADGGGLVILRPRVRLRVDEMERAAMYAQRATDAAHEAGHNITILLIPDDFDVILAGPAEVQRGVTLEPAQGL